MSLYSQHTLDKFILPSFDVPKRKYMSKGAKKEQEKNNFNNDSGAILT